MPRRVQGGATGGRGTHGSRRLLAVAAVVPAVLALALPAAASPGAGALLSLLNEARAEAGRPPLRHAPDLAAVATDHSEEMARSRTLRHNAALGRQVDRGQAIAENVAYSSSVEGLHRVLMRSSEHRESILSPTYDEVGVGLAGSDGRLWVTQVFRRSRSGAAPQVAPEPAPAPPPPAPAPVAPPPPPPVPPKSTTTLPPPAVTTSPTTTTVAPEDVVPTTVPPAEQTDVVPGESGPTTSTLPGSLPPDGFSEMPETESAPAPSPFAPGPPTSPVPPTSTSTTVAPTPSAVDTLAALLGLTPASHSREAQASPGVTAGEITGAALILMVLALASSPLRTREAALDEPERQEPDATP